MQNIAIFCKTLLKGGAEKQALLLTKLLSEENKNVILVSWCSDKIDPEHLTYIETNSLQYFALEGNWLKKYLGFLRIIRKEKISIVLSYLTFVNFIAGTSKLFLGDVKVIGGIRNEKLPYHKFLFERWIHNHLNNASVFNNFSAVQKFEERGFNSKKIFVIHNAIERNQLFARSREQISDVRIVTISRFVEQKDFRTALNSFKILIDMFNNKAISYYLIGYGPLEKEIRSMAENLNILSRIKIFINPTNIPDILKECDIYLSTSLFEGLSNSIMEAMSEGLPVVATNVGDNKYLVKDGINGYLVPCGDINFIAEKLKYLVESAEIRNEFGNNSRCIIEKDFIQGKFIQNYLRLFSEVQP